METKIKLKVGTIVDTQEISSVLVSCLSCEYLIDSLRTEFRKYSREIDLSKIISDFANAIEECYNTSFSSFVNWQSDKTDANADLLDVVQKLDKFLTEQKIINEREIVDRIQNNLVQFLSSLSKMTVTNEELDISGIEINSEYLSSAIEQLRLLDEGILISNLASMQLEFTPIETKQNRNKFIESKLDKLNNLTKSCNQTFDDDYSKLLNQILSMYDKFYNICYSSDTDGEKSEKARKVIKSLNPHRLLLDKLENKLEDANELKRQLKIHAKRLDDHLNEERNALDKQIDENIDKDLLEKKLQSTEFVAFDYSEKIDMAIDTLSSLQEKISNHYKVLDQLENSLKGAIPSEEEMNRYSSIVYKFKELAVRLELDKSQPIKPAKEIITLLNTSISGLRTLTEYAKDFKDLYLRNSMLTAIFRAVNDLNDFATSKNKGEQLNQINFVSKTLEKYNELANLFNGNIVTYRKIANDTVRNISIIISKEINATNISEIIQTIDVIIKNFESLYQNLLDNNKKQIDIMKEIMTL